MEYYIELASQNGNSYIVNTLLKSGADNKAKQAALIRATYNNRIEIVQLLIEYKTDVNVKDTNSNTPLHIATQRNHHELMDILMQNGADIEATDRKGFTPIHLALGFKNIKLWKCLSNIAPMSMQDHQKVQHHFTLLSAKVLKTVHNYL